MEDIRRQDLRLFWREMVTAPRLLILIAGSLFTFTLGRHNENLWVMVFGPALVFFVAGMMAWQDSEKRRFANRRMEALWKGCQDRMVRFEEALRRMRKEQVADLMEMPKSIRQVAGSLYVALRRADMIATEVQQSERGLYAEPPMWAAPSHDPQSRELYRVADKNIAEYRAQFAGVMAGVQRTEAQSAVFMTTVDTLRMKMIGYRLVGKSPELSSHDFLEALAEAKIQLQAIDTALDELDLSHYPKQISVIPDGPRGDKPEPIDRVRIQANLMAADPAVSQKTPPPLPADAIKPQPEEPLEQRGG